MADIAPLYTAEQITIPTELPEILKQFTKAAIKTQPEDLAGWATKYFLKLSGGRMIGGPSERIVSAGHERSNSVMSEDPPYSSDGYEMDDVDAAALAAQGPDAIVPSPREEPVGEASVENIRALKESLNGLPDELESRVLVELATGAGIPSEHAEDVVRLCGADDAETLLSCDEFLVLSLALLAEDVSEVCKLIFDVYADEDGALKTGSFITLFHHVASKDEEIDDMFIGAINDWLSSNSPETVTYSALMKSPVMSRASNDSGDEAEAEEEAEVEEEVEVQPGPEVDEVVEAEKAPEAVAEAEAEVEAEVEAEAETEEEAPEEAPEADVEAEAEAPEVEEAPEEVAEAEEAPEAEEAVDGEEEPESVQEEEAPEAEAEAEAEAEVDETAEEPAGAGETEEVEAEAEPEVDSQPEVSEEAVEESEEAETAEGALEEEEDGEAENAE